MACAVVLINLRKINVNVCIYVSFCGDFVCSEATNFEASFATSRDAKGLILPSGRLISEDLVAILRVRMF